LTGDTWLAIYNSSGKTVTWQFNDLNAANGDSFCDYYNSSGVLVSQFGTYDNASGSTLSGDTFSENFNANGSAASYTLNDITGKNGSSYTDFYNGSGLLLSQTGTYDSGMLLGDTYTYTYNANGSVASYVVNGSAGSNTLSGGTTAAVLNGDGGYDTYQIGRGSGQDRIVNGTGSGMAAQGELDVGVGVSTSQLWLLRSGNDLVVDIMGTHDQATIANWFGTSADAQLAHITTSDGSMLDNQICQLVQAMATYSANNSGFDPTLATQASNDAALQGAISAAWHH
jgi:hypothetical protein